MMGDKDLRFPGTHRSTIRFATNRKGDRRTLSWETRTCNRDPRHHHSVPKLQEGRHEAIMMADKSC